MTGGEPESPWKVSRVVFSSPFCKADIPPAGGFSAMARWLLLALAGEVASGIENGLGRTPPMGWRSWNLYGQNVNQSLVQSVMDGIVSKKRKVDGVPTSLCDLGYCDVGLDDNWQDCHAGQKYRYHDDSGIPVINRERFPDMIAMTSHAHKSLGFWFRWLDWGQLQMKDSHETAG